MKPRRALCAWEQGKHSEQAEIDLRAKEPSTYFWVFFSKKNLENTLYHKVSGHLFRCWEDTQSRSWGFRWRLIGGGGGRGLANQLSKSVLYCNSPARELLWLYLMQLKCMNTQQIGHNHKIPMSSLNTKEHEIIQRTFEKLSLEPKWLLVSCWRTRGKGQWIPEPFSKNPPPADFHRELGLFLWRKSSATTIRKLNVGKDSVRNNGFRFSSLMRCLAMLLKGIQEEQKAIFF